MVNKQIGRLLEGLFPNHCVLCGLRSQRPVPLCLACEQDFSSNDNCCLRCAIPLPVRRAVNTPRVCGLCQHSPPPFHRTLAPWLYSEHMAYLIHRWKYHGERRMTPLLAALWRQRVPVTTSIDTLVPVPLHWQRLWRRGFNQSELLCRQMQATCPQLRACKTAPHLVKRTRATAAQPGMNASQRSANLRGAFTVILPCDNLRIAIVDDVLTTGATATAMASALAAAGACHIEVWCLARTTAPGS